MFDASREEFGPSFERCSADEAFAPPSRYIGVRKGLVNGVMGKSLVASEPKQDTLSAEAIRNELSRILESSMFVQSDRLGRFLRFTVETTLAGKAEVLKEYLIGTEAYDRQPSYHPGEDSIVRSEARRLRRKLKEYYESVGKHDPVFIYYRPGSYVPVFRLQRSHSGNGTSIDAAPGELFTGGREIRVAVLPFLDASGSASSGACAQLITDELIHELVRTDGLRVTAASLVVAEPRDIPAIVRKLDVQIVFDGTVRQNQNQLRVISGIIDADGFHIWSERFETEADPHGLFKLSEKIVSALVSRIRPRTIVDPETERLSAGVDPRCLSFDLAA
jgi:TolB-like protein